MLKNFQFQSENNFNLKILLLVYKAKKHVFQHMLKDKFNEKKAHHLNTCRNHIHLHP